MIAKKVTAISLQSSDKKKNKIEKRKYFFVPVSLGLKM